MQRTFAFAVCLTLAVLSICSAAAAQYQLTNLVSNQVGAAKHTDPLLVNAWGLARSSGGPFWISDAGSGWSTLYNGAGVNQGLTVLIPTATGSFPGQPTGIVVTAHGSTDFQVGGWPAIFLFATLDGTISGWTFQSNVNQAIVAVTTTGAVYTGLAVTNKTSGNFLYAADVANNKVDMYDGNFNLVTSFTDPSLPTGTAPFGIQDINGLLYVSFAPSNGSNGGYVDIFREDGTFVRQLIAGKPLNQPWGFAVAPKNFGPLSNTLLVSNNNNSGTINGFNLETGQFVGTVKDTNGKPIHIDQLWGIEFGGGASGNANGNTNQLFFTAGPSGNLAGTFGVIEFK